MKTTNFVMKRANFIKKHHLVRFTFERFGTKELCVWSFGLFK